MGRRKKVITSFEILMKKVPGFATVVTGLEATGRREKEIEFIKSAVNNIPSEDMAEAFKQLRSTVFADVIHDHDVNDSKFRTRLCIKNNKGYSVEIWQQDYVYNKDANGEYVRKSLLVKTHLEIMKSYLDIQDYETSKPKVNNFDRMRVKVYGSTADITKYQGDTQLYARTNSGAEKE